MSIHFYKSISIYKLKVGRITVNIYEKYVTSETLIECTFLTWEYIMAQLRIGKYLRRKLLAPNIIFHTEKKTWWIWLHNVIAQKITNQWIKAIPAGYSVGFSTDKY